MSMVAEMRPIAPTISVGGKAHQLQKLVSWAAPVPPFFVITTNCYRWFRKHGSFPQDISERFRLFFQDHPVVALRSSMIAEDAAEASFAGLFDTILDVREGDWPRALHQVYASLESDRVREYVLQKKISIKLEMAVVVQALVRVDNSGVLFTRSPVTPTATVAIDAAFGMGEGVVSGHADVDTYRLARTGELVAATICAEIPVLSSSELDRLLKFGLALESKAGAPSDIEWGIKDGTLYVFQIRPITRRFEPLVYFVDTNLSESYPGTVSPFTAAFVKRAYQNVFRESAILMGAHGPRLEALNHHYSQLISEVDNHLYYNLEHYYAVLRALPGGERNIDNWHNMIGGKLGDHSIPYHATELTALETFQTGIALVRILTGRRQIFTRLLADLDRFQSEIEQEITTRRSPSELIRYLVAVTNRPLGFGLTVVNDIFIMMGLGYLTRKVKAQNLHEDTVIDLLKTDDGLDSVKPLEHFNQLIGELDEEFLREFAAQDLSIGLEPYGDIFRKLRGQGREREVNLMDDFLRCYGDRSFEELKLESLPLRNNPRLLSDLMLWCKKNTASTLASVTPPIKPDLGFIGNRILSYTRDAVSMREATRLWRGKFYHLIRQMVLALAGRLMESDPVWREFDLLDFFSLTSEEWLDFAEGRLSEHQVRERLRERRGWKDKRRHYPEVIAWVADEPLPEPTATRTQGALVGQGVSPGITEGTALVLENPRDVLVSDFTDFILVTKNTDPAWVYIMSRSQGLISEKGSLLSHTAIIGRELNIPTIVGVRGATQKIKTGDRLRLDAFKGTIEVL